MNRRLPQITMLFGSLLLFGIQPMVGSTLLPLFGGTAAVWTVCLAAFQMLLLAGYFQAHLASRPVALAAGRLWHCRGVRYHLTLLLLATGAALAAVWLRPRLGHLLGGEGVPSAEVLLAVLLLVGIPYTLLSANATLIQAWLNHSGRRDVYHLYGWSNVGSLCGLLAYPLLIEPHTSLTHQWWGFAVGVGLYSLLLTLLAWRLKRDEAGTAGHSSGAAAPPGQWEGQQGLQDPPATSPCASDVESVEAIEAIEAIEGVEGINSLDSVDSLDALESASPAARSARAPYLWLLLPALSTFLLNAITAHLGNDVTPLPLLWALLLALFLLSYVIGFAPRAQPLLPWLALLLLPLLFVDAWLLGTSATGGLFLPHVVLGGLTLLVGATLLHLWLYRVRPSDQLLTRYYFALALGGALGGVAASLLAPLLFNGIYEYPLALLLLALAALYQLPLLRPWLARFTTPPPEVVAGRMAHTKSRSHEAGGSTTAADSEGVKGIDSLDSVDSLDFLESPSSAARSARAPYHTAARSESTPYHTAARSESTPYHTAARSESTPYHTAASTPYHAAARSESHAAARSESTPYHTAARSPYRSTFHLSRPAWATLVALLLLILGRHNRAHDGTLILRQRNFYGCGYVTRNEMAVKGGTPYEANVFYHNSTLHGFQVLGSAGDVPTLCFTPHAGGLSIVNHPKYDSTNGLRVAIAGMGVGTLAAYSRPGDHYRFYEINPQVARLAATTNLFTFLSGARGTVEVVVDDARRALERERACGEPLWDVLIIDVYSGDAIPPHMATREAFQLYLDRLAPGGTLSLHLTNWHLGLSPLVKAAAREFGLHLQGYGCWADKYSHGSYWTFLTREPADYFIPGKHGRVDYEAIKDIPLMSDERHSLLPYLSRQPMPQFEGANWLR